MPTLVGLKNPKLLRYSNVPLLKMSHYILLAGKCGCLAIVRVFYLPKAGVLLHKVCFVRSSAWLWHRLGYDLDNHRNIALFYAWRKRNEDGPVSRNRDEYKNIYALDKCDDIIIMSPILGFKHIPRAIMFLSDKGQFYKACSASNCFPFCTFSSHSNVTELWKRSGK